MREESLEVDVFLHLFAPLREKIGSDEVELEIEEGSDVESALKSLVRVHPALSESIYHGDGELRAGLTLFLNDESLESKQGLATELEDGDELHLLPQVSGGKTPPRMSLESFFKSPRPLHFTELYSTDLHRDRAR